MTSRRYYVREDERLQPPPTPRERAKAASDAHRRILDLSTGSSLSPLPTWEDVMRDALTAQEKDLQERFDRERRADAEEAMESACSSLRYTIIQAPAPLMLNDEALKLLCGFLFRLEADARGRRNELQTTNRVPQ